MPSLMPVHHYMEIAGLWPCHLDESVGSRESGQCKAFSGRHLLQPRKIYKFISLVTRTVTGLGVKNASKSPVAC
jgi:hypothetical protein